MGEAALLSLIPSAFSLVYGLDQKRKANNLEEDRYIPPALRSAKSRAQFRTGVSQVPGQARAEEKIEKATANTISATRRNARDSSTVLEKVQQADVAAKEATQDINAQVQSYKDQNERDLNRVLSQEAQVQQENRNRYQAAKSALRGAAGQNIYNAISNATTVGVLATEGAGNNANPVDTATNATAPELTSKGITVDPAPVGTPKIKPINPVFNPMLGLSPEQIMQEVMSGKRSSVGYA